MGEEEDGIIAHVPFVAGQVPSGSIRCDGHSGGSLVSWICETEPMAGANFLRSIRARFFMIHSPLKCWRRIGLDDAGRFFISGRLRGPVNVF